MIKQIFKIIWSQRRSNGWIFSELLIIVGIVWIVLDGLIVKTKVYNLPLGYDITNTYWLRLSSLNNQSPGYVPEEMLTTNETEDLLQLMTRIRSNPEVEEVCVTYYSCPYSWGDSWTPLYPVDGDTLISSVKSFRVRRVTPEYFSVFRVKDKYGNPILPESIPSSGSQIIISADMEKAFFGERDGKGRKVQYWTEGPEISVADVCEPIRTMDYNLGAPCFYQILNKQDLEENVNYFSAASAELCVRMKQYKTEDQMNAFLEGISGQLTVNNLTVYGAVSLEKRRELYLSEDTKQMKIKIVLLIFMMVNVFFGIIGTFWLRTQYRKAEIGLRMVVGSDKKGIYRFMNLEGLCLLVTTVPLFILFAINIFTFDLFLDNVLPGGFIRYLSSIGGTYLLIAGIICLGISFPARKAVKIPPAEALHYE